MTPPQIWIRCPRCGRHVRPIDNEGLRPARHKTGRDWCRWWEQPRHHLHPEDASDGWSNYKP